jgi:hypothetical protein
MIMAEKVNGILDHRYRLSVRQEIPLPRPVREQGE